MSQNVGRETTEAESALRERVKELACLYAIARILAAPDCSLDEQVRSVVAVLPPAWQFPDKCVARITVDGNDYCAGEFDNVRHVQNAEILVEGKRRGTIDIGYTDERMPSGEEGPFLEEERQLIENIAEQLGSHIERRENEHHRRHLEEQLRHADRLATIGQLASGVAHEMNEPLASILGFAQLALKAPYLPKQLNSDLQQIVDSAMRGREVVKKLLLFARQAPPRKVLCDLNSVVRETVLLLDASGRKRGVVLEQQLSSDLPRVEGDPVQLRQVIVNLVVNAMQAIADHGSVVLETRARDRSVELVVADTGCGMTPQILEQVFDPFFTTKDVGEGTGLGLSVVHGIVTAHGGRICATSAPLQGARFVVTLPRAQNVLVDNRSTS